MTSDPSGTGSGARPAVVPSSPAVPGAGLLVDRTERDVQAIAAFLRLDRAGAVLGAVVVAALNVLAVREPGIWAVLVLLLGLVAVLTLAQRRLAAGSVVGALLLVALGNGTVAVLIAFLLPFLWPVMTLTVLMPLVLATPYLSEERVKRAMAAAAVTVGVVGTIGLLNDDGGVLPDLEDTLELWVVVGALAAHSIPIGLIVWQANLQQRAALARAVALNDALGQSRELLLASRRRVVAAADAERSRIERDLHDGAQARLVALGMQLRLLADRTAGTPAHEQVAQLVDDLGAATAELRELSHGIYPPLLATRGLAEALRAAARRFPLVDDGAVDDVGRLPRPAEEAVYFAALEALSNAAKHAPGAEVRVRLGRDGGEVALVVSDDGPGLDPDAVTGTHGLANLRDRVEAVGGRLDLRGRDGTTVSVRVAHPG